MPQHGFITDGAVPQDGTAWIHHNPISQPRTLAVIFSDRASLVKNEIVPILGSRKHDARRMTDKPNLRKLSIVEAGEAIERLVEVEDLGRNP